MGLPEIDIDHDLKKKWLKLFGLRCAVLLAHLIAIADGMGSMGQYALLQKCLKGGPCPGAGGGNAGANMTVTPVTPTKKVVKPAKVGICSMKGPYKEFDSHMFNFNMSLFVMLGFFGMAMINFIISCVINFRLVLCPIPCPVDACGNSFPTTWHKIRDATFNFATFPCDSLIMSCIIGVYASKRTKNGLGCWECFADPTCTTVDDYDSRLFMSSLSLNLNMMLVLTIVFYKGFITYFNATDPEKCDCHCVIPRCVTGCFISLITTSVIMMPPFVTLSNKYYDLPGVEGNLFSMIMGNMKMIGIIIWAVIGAVLFAVVPIKIVMARKAAK